MWWPGLRRPTRCGGSGTFPEPRRPSCGVPDPGRRITASTRCARTAPRRWTRRSPPTTASARGARRAAPAARTRVARLDVEVQLELVRVRAEPDRVELVGPLV